MTDKINKSNSFNEEVREFTKQVKDFALTVGEPCPEGHRKDAESGRCLPLGSIDHTAFTRSVNDDQGPEWRGEVDKNSTSAKETAVDADQMEELESCSEGTVFSFIQRRCISTEEAEAENSEDFATAEDGSPIFEEEDAAAPGQGGHDEITMMQPEGRRDTVNHNCPANMFFDYILRECIPLNKDTVMASEIFDEDFKKEVASGFARLALTSPDPMDGHRHVATLDEEGNGVTSVAGHMHPHSHEVKKFEVVPRTGKENGEEYTSQHPGVAVPTEHRIEPMDEIMVGNENKEGAAPITSKKRKGLPTSSFGVPGKRKFPLDTCARVRNAMARFNQAKGLTSSEKATLRRKILARASGCGIEVRNFGKAQTDEEFAQLTVELFRDVATRNKERLSMYASQENAQRGPCPPGMVWDVKNKKCMKTRGFVESIVANHSEIIMKQPDGRRDTVGFNCPQGQFFDFVMRRCLSLNPAQKEGTTTEQAEIEEAQRDLSPSPSGRPARLPQDCPAGTIWDKDLEKCKPLDSSKKTKSAEGEEGQTTPAGPGKDKDSKGCGPGEFMNPITKKCMPRKGAFKGKSDKEDAEHAVPSNREGLVDAPAGKVTHPTDCPPNHTWDSKNKICRPLDSMNKSRPDGASPQSPTSTAEVENMSLANVISHLDQIIKKEVAEARKGKFKVLAKELPAAAFPPSLVSPTKRSLMHHTPNVTDPYDNETVDVRRLRNALARCAKVEGFSSQAVTDGLEHLLFHAHTVIKEDLEKKE